MDSRPVNHPRFSVRNAFDEGLVDVSSGKYATAAGKQMQNAPRTMKCYNPDGRPIAMQQQQIKVQAEHGVNRTRKDRTRMDPKPQDRKYWKSKDRVDKVRWQVEPYVSDRTPKDIAEESTPLDRQHWMSTRRVDQIQQIPAEVNAGITREDNIRNGQREAEIQRQLRGRGGQPPIYGFSVALPAEALNGEEFTITIPENDFKKKIILEHDEMIEKQKRREEVQANPLPSHLAIDTADDHRNHEIAADADSPAERRAYWGGKNVVYAPSRFTAKNDDDE